MKIFVSIAFLVLCSAGTAQPYSAFFRYEPGIRIDLSDQNPKGDVSVDTMTNSAILHILVGQDGKTANVSLAYGKGAEGREDQTYSGVVVHRTEDMITIVCGFGREVDKVETITIFPEKKAGFLMGHSAYFGRGPIMKAVAETKPQVPFGSVSILCLRQFER